ncbi:hypothetical protein P8452_05669 [Trifolium repens]|nr:hypothetical protein P8452_05669 [Trifolium repens]
MVILTLIPTLPQCSSLAEIKYSQFQIAAVAFSFFASNLKSVAPNHVPPATDQNRLSVNAQFGLDLDRVHQLV